MNTTNLCGHDETLSRYLRGDLPKPAEASVERHLERCDVCRERLEELAGSNRWWGEAHDMLADFAADQPTEGHGARKKSGATSDRRLAGIDAHLSHWMGPTDDPTKLGRVGGYEVIGVVGYGGAGVVLKAHDNRLNRPVAIKVLLPALAHNPLARKRFERESRAVAAITHPNVVPIYAVDAFNGHPYIVMQYIAGQSLQQRIDAQGPLEPEEIIRIAAQVARALAAAHAQGVIHRDIKPANILLENNVDRVYVSDFGLALVIDDATTHSGVVTGTPQYMSPEQCYGHAVDHRSDLFSLGSVMYAMCVGRPPFRSETLMGMLRKVCEAKPRRIRDQNPDIPEWLELFIERLLEKRPDDRFASVDQVADCLESELAYLNNPIAAAVPKREWLPASAPTPTSPVSKRRSLMYASSLFAGFAGVAVLLAAFQASPGGGDDDSAENNDQNQAPASFTETDEGTFEATKEWKFDVESDGTLKVEIQDGRLLVETGDDDEVRVKALWSVSDAANEDEAHELIELHPVDASVEEDVVEVTCEEPESQDDDEETDDEDASASLEITYHLIVPKEFNAELTTVDGPVSVSGLQGPVSLESQDGPIAIQEVGGAVKLRSTDGPVIIKDCKGPVSVEKADGNIAVTGAGGAVELRSKDGNVLIEDCQGPLGIEKTDGNVSVKSVKGAVKLRNEDGNVQIETCAGPVEVEKHDGNVSVKSVEGAIRVSNGDGQMEIAESDGPLAVQHGDGNISVHDIASAVTVSSGEGHVDVQDCPGPVAVTNSEDGERTATLSAPRP
jgi:serine/threonine protein kinase